MTSKTTPPLREIYFAGGCFWGVEEYFSRIPGVYDSISGYANGNIPNPTYEEVCTGTTGFAETVRVIYEPDIVTLRILTEQYFKIINPVSINGRVMTGAANTEPVSFTQMRRIPQPFSL